MNARRPFALDAGLPPPASSEQAATRGTWRALLELARYFVASAAALGVDFVLYRLGLGIGWNYMLAALLGFCAGAVVAYVASVRWVFDARAVRNAGLEFGLFVAVGIGGLLLTELLLWLAIGKLGWPPLLAKLATSAVVFAFNFVLRKVLLFSARGVVPVEARVVQAVAGPAR
jgi:putative flippase GtrA